MGTEKQPRNSWLMLKNTRKNPALRKRHQSMEDCHLTCFISKRQNHHVPKQTSSNCWHCQSCFPQLSFGSISRTLRPLPRFCGLRKKGTIAGNHGFSREFWDMGYPMVFHGELDDDWGYPYFRVFSHFSSPKIWRFPVSLAGWPSLTAALQRLVVIDLVLHGLWPTLVFRIKHSISHYL